MVSWQGENRALGCILTDQALASPDRLAMTDAENGASYTYRQLDDLVNKTAYALVALGAVSGDFITLFSSNSAEYIIASYAIRKLGAVEVAVNAQARGEQLLHMLSMAPESIVLMSQDQIETFVDVAPGIRLPKAVILMDTADIEVFSAELSHRRAGMAVPPIYSLSAFRDTSPAVEIPADVDALSPAMVIFTSGTTGPSKGCLLTHRALIRSAESVGAALDVRPDDCMYTPFPLFHARASSLDVLPVFMAGGHVVVAKRFSLSRFWEDMVRFEITLFSIIGSMMQLLWKREPSDIERKHRVRLSWGGPITIEPADFEARFGVKVLPGEGVFGMSETGMLCMSSFDRETSGKVRRDLEVMIGDDQDASLPIGEVGEILVRSREPGVLFQGYVGMPEETLKACKNLWFHTGDLGKMDEAGHLFFIERKRDRIRVGGNNVSSWEVESVVARHSKVTEAIMIGVRNPLGEDDIALFVLPEPNCPLNHHEIIQFCRENLAEYAVPRFVIITSDIPRTETGKPAKAKMYDIFETKRDGSSADFFERPR